MRTKESLSFPRLTIGRPALNFRRHVVSWLWRVAFATGTAMLVFFLVEASIIAIFKASWLQIIYSICDKCGLPGAVVAKESRLGDGCFSSSALVVPTWAIYLEGMVFPLIRAACVILISLFLYHKVAFSDFYLPKCPRCNRPLSGLQAPICPHCQTDLRAIKAD